MKTPCTYIEASSPYGTLYTGVTSDILKRDWQHKTGAYEGFSKKYKCRILVWCQFHESMDEAIAAEKRVKKCSRAYKIGQIEQSNPTWDDLAPKLM